MSLRALAAALLVAAPALAVPSGHKWFQLPSSYRVFNHTGVNGIPTGFSTNVLPRIQNAFLTWTKTKVQCTSWDIAYLGGPLAGEPSVNGDGKQNVVIWQNSWGYGGGTLGLTMTTYYPGSGEIFDSDMEMNNTVLWSVTGSPSAYDLESVVLHEAGHFLGLDHTNTTYAAVMYPSIAPGDIKRALGTPDLNDVCNVYPGSGNPGAQGSSCLSDSNCASGLRCRSAQGSTSKICTVDCTQGQTCPSGYTCQPADVGSACLVPVGSPDLCKFCQTGADCSTGICITDGRHNWCSLTCTSALTCGNGYACASFGTSNYCVPNTSCTTQCTSSGQCPSGYGCVGGQCEATGNVGDRCEVSTYCKQCAVCIGTASAAYCRACCGGQGGGGECNSCSSTSCGTGFGCFQVGGSNDRVCVEASAANECESCSGVSCAQGLTCVGGRCHATCNPANPGACSACYNAGATGYCACPDERAYVGQPCGPNGASFTACVTGLACIGNPGVCRKRCTIGQAGTCSTSETCKTDPTTGIAVCMPGTSGARCGACNSGGGCDSNELTCFQGRCYERCTPGAATCSTCVEYASGIGLCACDDQRAGVHQFCGFLPPSEVYSCQEGLTCIANRCRMQCDPGNPSVCPVGTWCYPYGGSHLCLEPSYDAGEQGGGGGGSGGSGGGSGGGGGGGGGTIIDQGCGCTAGYGAIALWPALLFGLSRLRRRPR